LGEHHGGKKPASFLEFIASSILFAIGECKDDRIKTNTFGKGKG